MFNEKTSRNTLFALLATLGSTFGVQADDKGVVEDLTGFNINKTSFMDDLGIRMDGWFEFGIGGNPRDVSTLSNAPITFNDQTNEVTANELYYYIERAVNTEGDSWDIGFRADIVYGTDARFTTAANFDNQWLRDSDLYKLAMPQVYGEIFAPIGNGLTLTFGHFYTIIGYEVVTAPDNFFFSHAYTMQYGEPFTHFGGLISYPINNNFNFTGGIVTGWDSVMDAPPNFLGGLSYSTDDERTSVAVSLITGEEDLTNKHNRTLYSIVISHDFLDSLHYVFQHDHAVVQNASAPGGTNRWYGINQYLTYDVLDSLGVGLRFEWFRDEDGSRVLDGLGNNIGPNHYFAITGGVNWTPTSWLKIRPEVRYDWSINTPAYDVAGDVPSRFNQILISADAIIQF
ncbi:MAG: porin [Gammaproteobacteria bacterium]